MTYNIYRETDESLAASDQSTISVLSENHGKLRAELWRKMPEARDGTLRRLHIVGVPEPEAHVHDVMWAAEDALRTADPAAQFLVTRRDNWRHGELTWMQAWVSPKLVAHLIGEQLHIARNPKDTFDDIALEPRLSDMDGWTKHRLLVEGGA